MGAVSLPWIECEDEKDIFLQTYESTIIGNKSKIPEAKWVAIKISQPILCTFFEIIQKRWLVLANNQHHICAYNKKNTSPHTYIYISAILVILYIVLYICNCKLGIPIFLKWAVEFNACFAFRYKVLVWKGTKSLYLLKLRYNFSF